ncbi:hypothetical protein ACFFGR_09325 [Arthrobacter liuii]|uniref:Uncharacterized protein n=1 Tax=Arthrobacter liuii TaxID=1476996 RepID=A0ABQ2AM45_9MICC|nr:hypothetical protein [Arthrobacter liuii]GGH93835.1 hypothetical protein GCM10007170_15630 [Arthrobacter liuii]
MAGSYNHAVDERTGKLLNPDDLPRMVENLGDAYETIEEMYGMIWWLASRIDLLGPYPSTPAQTAEIVEDARVRYTAGLAASPGTDGELVHDGDD